MTSIDKKFELLEKKLNIATDLVSELDFDDIPTVCEVEVMSPVESTSKEIAMPGEQHEVFTLDALKSDFLLIRQNVMKLVATGQRILDTASVVDISDMKAADLKALASLQETLGNNLKLLVDMYRQICEIEKMRLGVSGKVPEGSVQQLNSGNTVTNNNIIFSGDTSALLDIIKQNQIT